jgi:hypothetical protein
MREQVAQPTQGCIHRPIWDGELDRSEEGTENQGEPEELKSAGLSQIDGRSMREGLLFLISHEE